jgi:hypothetical protein
MTWSCPSLPVVAASCAELIRIHPTAIRPGRRIHPTAIRPGRRIHQRQTARGCGCRPKPTLKANSGPQKVRPGSRLAAHGPLSLNGDAKGISPIIAERLSPNWMPAPRRRCCGPPQMRSRAARGSPRSPHKCEKEIATDTIPITAALRCSRSPPGGRDALISWRK